MIRFAVRQGDTEVLVVLVAGAAFGLAMAANAFGYSVALGAFISGMAVAESGRGHDVEHAMEPLRSLFSAIFFVSIGMTVDPLVAWRSLPLISSTPIPAKANAPEMAISSGSAGVANT